MPFQKMQTKLPTRQWAIVGHPGSGKSTFAAQMQSPMVVIDADHRFAEVMRHVAGDVFSLSDNASDNVDAERVAALLRQNMAGSGVRTIVIDSLTAIIVPLVTAAVMDNDAGRNKNRSAAFKPKALAMRLLQDAITGYGVDTLWVYHLRSGMNGQAQAIETTSISTVELARLRRSLNMQLRVVEQAGKRGVVVDWARCGRSGLTLWDDTGCWKGMPERIEQAAYGGLTVEDMERIADSVPTSFVSAQAAIAWGFEQGAFNDAVHAQNAYDKLKGEKSPKTASEMWSLWIIEVQERLQHEAA